MLGFHADFCLTACNQEKPAEKTANPTEATTEAATESSESVETEAVKKLTVGDTYFYGSYEQDNDTSNGKESIEWIVLDVQEDKALLISKYVLDCQQYYENFEDITWEKSDLRQWLNNDFLNTAFSNEEITQIVLTTVISFLSAV